MLTLPRLLIRFVPALAVLTLLCGCETLNSLNPFTGSDNSSMKEANQAKAAKAAADKAADLSNVPVETMYNNGVDALNIKRYKLAVVQFDNVEQYYPYSSWATNAQLMHGYADYLQDNYTDAISVLDRFIQLHPANRDIAYAYYLRSLSYYEQIADIQRDQKGTQEAMSALQEVVNRFPDSSYGRDAKLKIDLCRDHLAGKEMEIGRWYEGQHLYTAAINRFQRVVDDYQTTNHAPEALHRLTEIYLILGLTDQAKRTAAVLGHNYPGTSWYADSYDQLIADGQVPDSHGHIETQGFFGRTFSSIF